MKTLRLSWKIDLIALITVLGFFFAVAFHYIATWYYPHLGPTTFLFEPHRQFSDLHATLSGGRHLSPYVGDGSGGASSTYFPFAYLFIRILCPFGNEDLDHEWILLYPLGLWLLNWFFFSKQQPLEPFLNRVKNTVILTLMTYPFLFCFERGNLEGPIFLLTALALICYWKGRYYWAAGILALPISMKLSPAIFLILFIADRRFKPFVFSGLVTIALTVLSLWIFHGGFYQQIQGLFAALHWFNDYFVLGSAGIQRNVSFYAIFSLFRVYAQHINILQNFYPMSEKVVTYYSVIMMTLFAGMTAFIVYVEKEFWRRVALLTGALLLFPTISFDYHLLNIFLPLYFFSLLPTKKYSDFLYVGLLGLLLIPKDYYDFQGVVPIAGVINASLILIMTLALMIETTADRFKQQHS